MRRARLDSEWSKVAPCETPEAGDLAVIDRLIKQLNTWPPETGRP